MQFKMGIGIAVINLLTFISPVSALRMSLAMALSGPMSGSADEVCQFHLPSSFNDSAEHVGACKEVTIFTVRGTCEKYENSGGLFLAPLAKTIQSKNMDSEVIDLPYAASWETLNDTMSYRESNTKGIEMLRDVCLFIILVLACPISERVYLPWCF